MLAALVEAGPRRALPRARLRGDPRAIVAAFGERIEYAVTTHVDYKTELQEELARLGRPSYVVLEVEGPPHERHFTCAAVVDGEQAGVGDGASKKAAEQSAAREALASLPRRQGR